MSDTVQIFNTIFNFLGIVISAFIAYKAITFGKKQDKIENKQELIHKEFNGMKDMLVKQSGDAGEIKGNKQGRIEEKAEQKIRDDKK